MDAMQPGSGAGGTSAKAGHTAGMQLLSEGREVIPALGLAWANCINSRIFLSKAATRGGATRLMYSGPPGHSMQAAVAAGAAKPWQFSPQLRHMQIVFSPFLPQRRCAYIVETTGIRGVLPQEEEGATTAVQVVQPAAVLPGGTSWANNATCSPS